MSSHSPADVLAVVTSSDPLLRAVKAGASNKVSDEVFAKMSAADRLDYCRQFDQKQYLPSGRRT